MGRLASNDENHSQGTLSSSSILRALGLQGSQDAGDIVLAGLEVLAQRRGNGQGGEGDDDGATHIDFLSGKMSTAQ